LHLCSYNVCGIEFLELNGTNIFLRHVQKKCHCFTGALKHGRGSKRKMTEENRKESSTIFLQNEEGTSRTMNLAVLDCRRN